MTQYQLLSALERLVAVLKDMRADEDFDASSCDAGGILFGDETSEAMEEAQSLLTAAGFPVEDKANAR